MTVIVNTFWGGRVSQIVDRQISRRLNIRSHEVVDRESNKLCIVLAKDALVSIAYTGVAVANESWIDCVIANCLAHRKLKFSIVQPGSSYLYRPIHELVRELSINLNGQLNSDKKSRIYDLRISIVGWHLSKKPSPLAWELKRRPAQENRNRYFEISHHKVGKFLREKPTGLWGETLGDVTPTFDDKINKLAETEGYTHDDVERYIRGVILSRAQETQTVSSECIGVQIDLKNPDGQVQVTFYPDKKSPLLSPWILTPRMVCAPSLMNSACCPNSVCKKYVVGGFSDGNTNLNVFTRIPIEFKQRSKGIWAVNCLDRPKAC